MRVLITGGYGFIGAWIARNLLARGAQIWVFDLREDARRLRLVLPEAEVKKVTFVQGDVTDLAALKKAIADFGITHIIHLAGLQVPTCRTDPMLGAKVNVLGTLAVFEAVKAAGSQIKRLVYASSAAVFGGPDKYPAGSLADDVLLTPSTHYGIFKCCNEGNARIYFQDSGISSVGLRPWTVYGVGRDLGMTSEPTKAIKAVLLGRPYQINFGGWSDFQYVDDVAKDVHRVPRPALYGSQELQPPRRGCHAEGLPQGFDGSSARRGKAGNHRHDPDCHRLRSQRRRSRTRSWPDAENVARGRHPRDGGDLQTTPGRGTARYERSRSSQSCPGYRGRRTVTNCLDFFRGPRASRPHSLESSEGLRDLGKAIGDVQASGRDARCPQNEDNSPSSNELPEARKFPQDAQAREVTPRGLCHGCKRISNRFVPFLLSGKSCNDPATVHTFCNSHPDTHERLGFPGRDAIPNDFGSEWHGHCNGVDHERNNETKPEKDNCHDPEHQQQQRCQ